MSFFGKGNLYCCFLWCHNPTNDTILRYRKQWHQNLHKGLGHSPENPPVPFRTLFLENVVTWDSQTQFADKHLKQGITKNFNTSMGLSSKASRRGFSGWAFRDGRYLHFLGCHGNRQLSGGYQKDPVWNLNMKTMPQRYGAWELQQGHWCSKTALVCK